MKARSRGPLPNKGGFPKDAQHTALPVLLGRHHASTSAKCDVPWLDMRFFPQRLSVARQLAYNVLPL